MTRRVLSLAVLPLLGALPALAQVPDTARQLSTVRVTVSRDASRPTLELPYGVSRLSLESDRAGTRRASLTEVLLFVPGLSVSNRFNPTQDPRLSVRGFGARSAFGIRGVRVLRDGIPLTVADGQTAVDVVDLQSLGSAELFRGSAGALYGNSSGGVIDFKTPAPPDSGGRGEVFGSYAGSIARASLGAARRVGSVGVQGTVSRNAGDGPRDYSTFQSTNVLGDARWVTGATQWQLQASLYDAPEAENPGALTRSQMENTPTLADSTNILRKAGKAVTQSIVSLQATHAMGGATVTGNVHAAWRDLDNPLAFAIVDLERQTMGGSIRAQVPLGTDRRAPRIAAGVDYTSQSDERLNFFNCAGRTGAGRPAASCPTAADRGVVTLDQRERVSAIGAYVRGEAYVTPTVSVTGTLRGDQTRFTVLDRIGAPSEEPSRTLGAISPMVGINWRVGLLSSAYASISTSFETPTTTELANQPDGSGGLNRELDPQRGVAYEVGFKGLRLSGLRYDIAAYRIDTQDELIPFEIPGGDGRRYFRNAGKTSRLGAEASVSGTAGPLTLGTTATWLQYEYEDFTVAGTSFDGNKVPGVAPLTVSAFASVSPTWGVVALEAQRVNRQPVNDANTDYADGYLVANARVVLRIPTGLAIEPVFGVDNLFDKTYAANVAVNANQNLASAARRYFEPGAGRTFYLALRMATRR